jgi:hypothetical protein
MEHSHFLSDSGHPSIKEKASNLANEKLSDLEKLERVFYFVRDDVKFGFPRKWDKAKASEVLESGIGTCNTKATLLIALCRACGISARAHCGLINVEIMRGVFPSFAFAFLPKAASHTWSEVEIDGVWKPIDSYINDKDFYRGALEHLAKSTGRIGYSIAITEGRSSCEFNFGEKGFVQMGGVLKDHGTWEDLSQYFSSKLYVSLNPLQLMFYPMLAKLSNKNVEHIRSSRSRD